VIGLAIFFTIWGAGAGFWHGLEYAETHQTKCPPQSEEDREDLGEIEELGL
jgi:hypothetical protein